MSSIMMIVSDGGAFCFGQYIPGKAADLVKQFANTALQAGRYPHLPVKVSRLYGTFRNSLDTMKTIGTLAEVAELPKRAIDRELQ
jgi:hypothetical protein